MVLLRREKFKGPLLHPARPCTRAQLQLHVGSVRALCQLGMCDWAKEKAVPCHRIWAPVTLRHSRSVLASLHRETAGETCSCQTTAHSCSGILTPFEGHPSWFRISSLSPEPCRALSSVYTSCKPACSRVSSLLVQS